MRTFDKILVDQLMSLHLFAFEDQLTHFLQMCLRLRTIIGVGRTAPEGLFVDLDFLGLGTALDHSAQLGVADG